MVEAEQTNYVNDYKEKNKILFELGTDGFNTKYYIGGICYCPLEYKKWDMCMKKQKTVLI